MTKLTEYPLIEQFPSQPPPARFPSISEFVSAVMWNLTAIKGCGMGFKEKRHPADELLILRAKRFEWKSIERTGETSVETERRFRVERSSKLNLERYGFAEARIRKQIEITREWCRKSISNRADVLSKYLFNYRESRLMLKGFGEALERFASHYQAHTWSAACMGPAITYQHLGKEGSVSKFPFKLKSRYLGECRI